MDYHISFLTYHHHVAIHEDGKREVEEEYSKVYSHICTHYNILANHLSISVCIPKQKSVNMKAMRNGEVNLLLKENFKRLCVRDEFGKIRLELHTRN
jgi:hypothetical protein